MNVLLTRLGIPTEIQAFFKASDDLSFDYGDQYEHYDNAFHIVPSTTNLWFSGTPNAAHLIITHSVMEAMAFITINRHRYPRLEQLAFVAIGNRLHGKQVDWIRQRFPKRKITLVFGKDLIGHVTDIRFTTALKNFKVFVSYANHRLTIQRHEQVRIFEEDQISLHYFRLAFGIRANIRTLKSTTALTFLDQLKHGINQ